MKMEVSVMGVGWAVAVAVGLVAVIGLVLLAWIGGELHYRNCITEADLRYPAAAGTTVGPATKLEQERRSDAIGGCSRWP
jgi:ABC-type phosphate transport system auxiliary subunit